MRDFIYLYKYKALYAVSLVIALYIAMNSISGASNYNEGFFNFFLVMVFICLGIYFRTKDMARKK